MYKSASRLALAAWTLAMSAGPLPAQMRLGTPESISMIVERTGSNEKGCGFRADYAFPDNTIRVEILAMRAPVGVAFSLQAFAPTSVTPPMRDIWLRTPTYFTVGMFQAGRVNPKGLLEARGEMSGPDAAILLRELAGGGTEISLVFDGTLPFSRVPVALPKPLPPDVQASFETCMAGLQ